MWLRGPVHVTADLDGVEHHAWCYVCQAPLRVRVPLLLAGRPAGVLEVCPGCGTGHDHASVTVQPVPAERWNLRRWLQRTLHPAAVARAAHRLACRRMPALECAYGECHWPGLWRLVVEVPGDDGNWRYVFCRRSHQRAWGTEHGIIIDPRLGMGEQVEIPRW